MSATVVSREYISEYACHFHFSPCFFVICKFIFEIQIYFQTYLTFLLTLAV